ncbi:hypothetical protein BDA96_08G064600 [Sorghum bicolor]|uniref:Transmembrane protein n=1 Tax=Sorghum bicolor TaxID=4558 RepID=A0A921QFX3_SORBI|nr:hypothetical protein BDA96_08G064600 [Sorghum bicolor]
MKAPRPSLQLLVVLRFLAILASAFFIILIVHVKPAQGGRQPNSPPSPDPNANPGSHCCNRR